MSKRAILPPWLPWVILLIGAIIGFLSGNNSTPSHLTDEEKMEQQVRSWKI